MNSFIKAIINILIIEMKRKHFIRYSMSDANNVFIWSLFYLFVAFRNWRKIYENKASKFFGSSVFSIGSGRMGLYAILRLFGIGLGDEVLLTGYTCVVCPNAVAYTGAKPIFVDIDPANYGIDPARIEEKITANTKAIVIQHTYGIPARLEEIISIARKHHLIVIEDCAHALGGEYLNKRLGTFGDASFYSTDHTKMISTSLGGGIILNDQRYYGELKSICAAMPDLPIKNMLKIYFQYAFNALMAIPRLNWFGCYFMRLYFRSGFSFYFHDENIIDKNNILEYPYPTKMTNFQAYVAVKEFERLDKNLRHRTKIVKEYESLFGVDYGGLPLLMFPILVEDPEKWRKIFRPYIEVFDWFSSPLYGRQRMEAEDGCLKNNCPTAWAVSKRIINFPTNLRIDSQALKLITALVEDNCLSVGV